MKKLKTKQEALDWLNSENIGVVECRFVLQVPGRMYPIYLDNTEDLLRWCNEDRENQEEAKED